MTTVRFNDGRVAHGSIWEWRPRDGYFTLTDDASGSVVRIDLATVATVRTRGQRLNASGAVGDIDELERARRDGWAPPCS